MMTGAGGYDLPASLSLKQLVCQFQIG